jgi:threonine aldolase
MTAAPHDLDPAFASDNYAGAHPEVLAAISEANSGPAPAYGADRWTARLEQVVRGHFGTSAAVFPVFNGTGANVVSLQAMLPKWGAVICAEGAHIATDEGGAPERVAGIKLLTVATPDGKLTPELVDRQAWGFGDEHRAQPAVVSVTQSSEVGTIYRPDELARLAEHAHALGMRVHLDGARLANAAAALGVSLAEATTEVGVDVVSLGGTKNGALFAEAVVVIDPVAAPGVRYLRKSDTQLASKMRFLSAQLLALYEGDLWVRSARHANTMASRLAAGLAEVPGVGLAHPVEANGVFAIVPAALVALLRESYHFYDWDREREVVRLMCSWNTTEGAVDALVDSFRRAAQGAGSR